MSITGALEGSGFLPPILVEIVGSAAQLKATLVEASAQLKAFEAQGVSTSTKFGSVMGKALMATVGTALVGIGVEAVHAADQFDVARARFRTMAENMGVSFGSIQKGVGGVDSSLAKFGFTNAQVETAMARLAQMTANPTEAMKNMTQVANLAIGANVSLTQAAQMYGRALNGQTGMLSRFLGDLHDVTGAQMSSQQVLARVNTLMAAQAQAYGETFPGKVAAFKAEFVNLETELGQKLLPVVEAVASGFGSFFSLISKNMGVVEVFAGAMAVLSAPALAHAGIGKLTSVARTIGSGLSWATGGGAVKTVAGEAEGVAKKVVGYAPATSLTALMTAADAAALALTRLAESSLFSAVGGAGAGGTSSLASLLSASWGPGAKGAAQDEQNLVADFKATQSGLTEKAVSVGGGVVTAGFTAKMLSRIKGVGKAGGNIAKMLGLAKNAAVPAAGEAAGGEAGLAAAAPEIGALVANPVGLAIAGTALAVGGGWWWSSHQKSHAQKQADQLTASYMNSIKGESSGQQVGDLTSRINQLKKDVSANVHKGGFLGGLTGGFESAFGFGGGGTRNKQRDEIKDLQDHLSTANSGTGMLTTAQLFQMQPLNDMIGALRKFPGAAGAAKDAQLALNNAVDASGTLDQQALQHLDQMEQSMLQLVQSSQQLAQANLQVSSAQLQVKQASWSLFILPIEQSHQYTDALHSLADAQFQAANSAYTEEQAQRSLAEAQALANVQIDEATNKVAETQISQQKSTLSVYDAQRQLYALMGSGSATLEQVLNAQLDLRSAQLSTKDASDQLTQAQVDKQYMMSQDGKTTQAVVDAQHGLAGAVNSAKDAQNSLNDAFFAANQANPKTEGNVLSLAAATQGLATAQQGVGTAVSTLAGDQLSYNTQLSTTLGLMQKYPQYIQPMLTMLNNLTKDNPALASILAPFVSALQASENALTGGQAGTPPPGPAPAPPISLPNYYGGVAGTGPAPGTPVSGSGSFGSLPVGGLPSGYAPTTTTTGPTPHTVIVQVTQTNPSPQDIARAVGNVLPTRR